MAIDFTPNAAERARQQRSLLQALQTGPVTTLQAREGLGIGHPAGRVLDLRKQGLRIKTERTRATDAQGRLHTSARYVLEGVAA